MKTTSIILSALAALGASADMLYSRDLPFENDLLIRDALADADLFDGLYAELNARDFDDDFLSARELLEEELFSSWKAKRAGIMGLPSSYTMCGSKLPPPRPRLPPFHKPSRANTTSSRAENTMVSPNAISESLRGKCSHFGNAEKYRINPNCEGRKLTHCDVDALTREKSATPRGLVRSIFAQTSGGTLYCGTMTHEGAGSGKYHMCK